MGVAIENIGEDDLRGTLVELSGQSHDEQRPSIAEHALAGSLVKRIAHCLEFLAQQEQGEHRTGELYPEHPHHFQVKVGVVDAEEIDVHGRQHNEIERHAHDVHGNTHHLQQCELDRFMGITQIGKGDRREGVDGHAHAHDHQIFGMVRIADGAGYRMYKQRQQHHEEQ